jgi:hypothetical protein
MATAQPTFASPIARRNLAVTAAVLATLLGAYLLWPLLTPVHVEGFTASVASLAIHLDRDLISNFDTLQPLNLEYFGLSKLGWVLGIAGLMKAGLASSAAMTLLNWAGFASLCGAALFLVRKWTKAPWLLIALGLLLLPGISESAFFFNDNVPSSALAALALAALYAKRLEFGSLLCGLLFGLAVLTRTDTVLMAAAIPILAWERTRDVRKTVETVALAGGAAVAILMGTLALFNASLFDVFRVANAAVATWDRASSTFRPLFMSVFFVGLPGMLLVACGLYALIHRRSWVELARLLAVPLAFALLIGSRLWEARQLLPLTPFFVALGVRGFQQLAGLGSRNGLILRSMLIALLAMSLLGPAQASLQEDGPHALGGRLANIMRWRDWQRGVDRDFALLATLPNQSDRTRPLAVIADGWNEDRYSHLALQEAGYAIQPSSSRECARIAERFVRGGDEIYLVRPHQGYVPYWRQLAGQRMRRFGLPCIENVEATAVFVASQTRSNKLIGVPRPPPADAAFVPLAMASLDGLTLAKLVRGYEENADEDRLSERSSGSLEEAAAATARRTKFGL